MTLELINSQKQKYMDAFNSGDVNALTALHSDNAIVMPSNAPKIIGKDQISEFNAALDGNQSASLTLNTDTIEVIEDTAIETGHHYMTITENNISKETNHGNYVIIWKKINNKWLIHIDIWNNSEN